MGRPGWGTWWRGAGSRRDLRKRVPMVERCEERALLASSLSGFVYSDLNNDGVKQAGEPAVAGAKVLLAGVADDTTIVTLTATTDASGIYGFGNLPPGRYSIQETPPANSTWQAGKVTQGTPGNGTVGVRLISNITLADNVNGVNNNFSELKPTPNVVSNLMLITRRGPSKVIVTFDRTLDASLARNKASYQVAIAVPGFVDVYQPVRIVAVALDARRQTVTLSLARRLDPFATNVLFVRGRLVPSTLPVNFEGTVGRIPPGVGPIVVRSQR